MDLDHTPANATDWTPLIWATYKGDVSAVASLLDSRTDHLYYDSSGRTALHWAVLKGHPGLVRMLLERHTKYLTNEHTENLAIRNLSYEQVKRSTLSSTPIELAAETKNNTIFNILIENLQLEFAPAQFNGVWALSGDSINRLSPARIILSRNIEIFDLRHIERIDEREIGTLPFTRRRLLQMAIGGDKYAIVDMLLTQESECPNAFGFGVPTALHTALHVAAMSRGGSRYVCRLVQHGRNPIHVHSRGATALGHAIVFGDEDTITALLECGASPHAVYLGQTPLALACEVVVKEDPHLPLRLVRQLLAKGARVHTPNICSPLHTAARFSTLEVIKELVSLGADVTSGYRGRSILDALAEEQGYKVDDTPVFKETLEFLMGHFPSGHTFDSESILARTLGKCNPDMFLTFVNAGFSWTDFNEDGFRVRMEYALKQCSIPTVSLLLESIQDRNDFVENGFLHMLLRPRQPTGIDRDFLDSFLFFLSHFVETGVITDATDGLVPLIAEYNGVDPEVIAQALLDCGADRYRVIWNGYDSIAFSAFYGKPEILAVLLHDRPHSSHHWLQWFDSFRPTVPDDTTAVFCSLKKAGILDSIPLMSPYSSPIYIATKRGDSDTVSKLILAGVDIEKQDYDGWRPLHLALFHNHESVAHILLDAGADVNATTTHCGKYGPNHPVRMSWAGRPLHFAAIQGIKSVAQRLIALGADINASSIPSGRKHEPSHLPTALDVALDNVTYNYQGPLVLSDARLSVAQLLVDHGADTAGVISHLGPADVLQFANYQSLWDTLRAGQTSSC